MSRFVVAQSLDDAARRLADDPGLRPIAGGVGVLLERALGRPTAERWLVVGGLAELRELRVAGDSLLIGAATSVEALAGPEAGLPVPALLGAAAGSIADPGIRVVATAGGNVVAGRGWSDLATALVALDARAEVVGPGGTREVPVDEVAAGKAPAPGELLWRFRVPLAERGFGWQRLTLRGAMDRSSATVAVTAGLSDGRVVIGCVADRLYPLPRVEGLLATRGSGTPERDAVLREAAADLDAIPIADDERASAAYRRRVGAVLVSRAVASATQQ